MVSRDRRHLFVTPCPPGIVFVLRTSSITRISLTLDALRHHMLQTCRSSFFSCLLLFQLADNFDLDTVLWADKEWFDAVDYHDTYCGTFSSLTVD